MAGGGLRALQAGGIDNRSGAIHSHYIWVTGMLQQQQADLGHFMQEEKWWKL